MGKTALAGVLSIVLLSGCGILPPGATPPKPTPTPTVVVEAPPLVSSAPTTGPTSTPAPVQPTATVIPPTATPQTLVVSAGGDGVFIRIVPEKTDRYKAWPDGTPMIVAGTDRTVAGRTWKNVQDPDGNVGWIPTEYLKPAPTPTVANRPTATATTSG